MRSLEAKSFNHPDETRPFESGKMEIVRLGETTIGRATLQPGWKWSTCVKPIAQTESCQVAHLGYMCAGRMKVVMDDGSERELGPGDMASIAPGQDAWVVGNEPVVFVEFSGAGSYARPGGGA